MILKAWDITQTLRLIITRNRTNWWTWTYFMTFQQLLLIWNVIYRWPICERGQRLRNVIKRFDEETVQQTQRLEYNKETSTSGASKNLTATSWSYSAWKGNSMIAEFVEFRFAVNVFKETEDNRIYAIGRRTHWWKWFLNNSFFRLKLFFHNECCSWKCRISYLFFCTCLWWVILKHF